MAGQVVYENFQKLTSEIETLKQTKGETFTRQMCDELELMRQHVLAHERQLMEISGVDAHHQLLIDNLGLAYAQLMATIESSKARPDAADMPGWQRPPCRSNGIPHEHSYGGCGGCSGNSWGKQWGGWNYGGSGGELGGSEQEAAEVALGREVLS